MQKRVQDCPRRGQLLLVPEAKNRHDRQLEAGNVLGAVSEVDSSMLRLAITQALKKKRQQAEEKIAADTITGRLQDQTRFYETGSWSGTHY